MRSLGLTLICWGILHSVGVDGFAIPYLARFGGMMGGAGYENHVDGKAIGPGRRVRSMYSGSWEEKLNDLPAVKQPHPHYRLRGRDASNATTITFTSDDTQNTASPTNFESTTSIVRGSAVQITDVPSGTPLDLSTIIGTAIAAAAQAAESDSSFDFTMTVTVTFDDSADATAAAASSDPPTVTVTATTTDFFIPTAVEADGTVIVTATDSTITSTTAQGVVTYISTSSNSAAFGGAVGQVNAASALTAGQVVTVDGTPFGGVAGAINVDTTTGTSDTTFASTDPTSTADIFSTSTSTPGFGGAAGAINVDTTTDTTDVTATVSSDPTFITDTFSASTSTPARGVGAFGGAVGAVPSPTNLISTATEFAGFGGVAGFVLPTAVTKRGTVVVNVDITAGQPSMSLVDSADLVASVVSVNVDDTTTVSSPDTTSTVTAADAVADPPTTTTSTTTSTATDTAAAAPVVVVVVTSYTTVLPSSIATTTSSSTSNSNTADFIETVTATVTVPASNASAAPITPLSISQIIAACTNTTGGVSTVANRTLAGVVFPVNGTDAPSGDVIECSTLLELLGVNVTSSKRRRDINDIRRRLFKGAF
jgi:hypothetical protein